MSIPKTSGERVKLARSLLGFTRNTLSEKYDINYNTLQSWEIGRIQLTPKGAEKLSSALVQEGILCTSEWLLNGKGLFPMPMFNSKDNDFPKTEKAKNFLFEVEVFKAIHQDAATMPIQDDGMLPMYEMGDYVAGLKKFGATNIEKLIGNNCIVETRSGETLVRKLVGGSKKPLFSLLCTNHGSAMAPVFIPDVKLRYAAKIIWHRKKEERNEGEEEN